MVRATPTATPEPGALRAGAALRYAQTRNRTTSLVAHLAAEDQAIQSMPDASPAKWHLAHTSWFFETFILAQHAEGYAFYDPSYGYLFNSYYEAEGPRHPRPQRGMLSRPSLEDVHAYRRHVDEAMKRLLASQGSQDARIAALCELGVNHEEQHQELILMDIKHLFSLNPLSPSFGAFPPALVRDAEESGWVSFSGGLVEIGADGKSFAFDNEGPRHKVWLEPFSLASRLATNGEFAAFIEDGGYERPEFWLSDGWAKAAAEDWRAPLYWRRSEEGWRIFTLAGEQPLNPASPVCHVSYYEADAFARWAGARLPREAEWEHAAAGIAVKGNFAESRYFHPMPAPRGEGLLQMFGDVWEWTQSPYTAYPGYKAADGAIGEYNGKFMCGQFVLKGGCAASPPGHLRASYRNFFPPAARWAFSGVRLARDE